MNTRVIRAEYSSMVDIMVFHPLLDANVDEYRHKENLVVEVPFEEYLNFILYTLERKKFLFTESATLKAWVHKHITGNDGTMKQNLYRNYILDVASAAAKELHLAERRNKAATLIRYCTVTSPKVIKASEEIVEYDAGTYREFYRRLELLGYQFPKTFRCEHNRRVANFIDVSVKAVLKPNCEEFILVGW